MVVAALVAMGCAGDENGRDLAAGWRGLLGIRGAQLGEPVALPRAPYADAVFTGKIASRRLVEASGLALSRLRNDLLWSINDGGHTPRLFAFGTDGVDLGSVGVADPQEKPESDWESLATFEHAGHAYLVVADVGDNFSWRRSSELLVIEEPPLTGDGFAEGATARVAWRVRFRFEDGPRDCEALAIDPATRHALLISKRTEPPVLYELPLLPEAGEAGTLRVARRLGTLPGIPPPTRDDIAESRYLGRYRSMPTGLDLSADGRLAAVVTYKDAYLFRRSEGEEWATAFARTPEKIPLPPMRQAEAISFAPDQRSLYVTSEKRPAPLYRLDWRGGARGRRGGRVEVLKLLPGAIGFLARPSSNFNTSTRPR